MLQKFPFILVGVVILVAIGVVFFAVTVEKQPQPVACTEEAKVCPDGSAVGRTGPQCEFAKCPEVKPGPDVTGEGTTTAKINQKISVQGVFFTPLEVLEDSRCPIDVTCIQAGTVRVKVRLESKGNVQATTLVLQSPITFSGKRMELSNVFPISHSTRPISDDQYRFTFLVTSVVPATTGILRGEMSIGPICPVERVDNPCTPTPEMYAARKVFVYKSSDKKNLVATLTPDADGKFSTTLPVGTYYLDMMHQQGPGGISGVPATIKILDGKTVELSISVDTGIR